MSISGPSYGDLKPYYDNPARDYGPKKSAEPNLELDRVHFDTADEDFVVADDAGALAHFYPRTVYAPIELAKTKLSATDEPPAPQRRPRVRRPWHLPRTSRSALPAPIPTSSEADLRSA
jgi:hypothetical protein